MTAQLVTTDPDPIARHVAALGRHLDGPRRAKADMLREVRHGLIDTAAAHEADGVPAAEAVRLAVDEFGDPVELAEGFQVELAARQARFTLAFLAVQGPVMEVASRILWSNSPRAASSPPEIAHVLARVEDTSAWVMSVAAALALVAFGLGSRWLGFRSRLVRLVAYTMLGKLVFIAVTAPLLTVLFDPGDPQGSTAVFSYVFNLGGAALLTAMAWLSWRCLKVARRVDTLSAG
ncbi:MAG: permease prefix domain 1-containing protein [Stackebrandtia sp.]